MNSNISGGLIPSNAGFTGAGSYTLTPVTSNITWIAPYNPFSRPGGQSDNLTHTVCLANNYTVQATCCAQLGGVYYDYGDGVVSSGKANSTGAVVQDTTTGFLNWCQLPNGNTYNDHYNSAPDIVNSFGTCFIASAPASTNPGIYASNVTLNSNVYMCELTGNFSGSNVFGLPTVYAASTGTSGAALGREIKGGMLAYAAVLGLMGSLALGSIAL